MTTRSFTGRAVLDDGVLSSASSVTVGVDPVRSTVTSAPGAAVSGFSGAMSAPFTLTETGPAGTMMYGPTLGEVRPEATVVPLTATVTGSDGATLAATRTRADGFSAGVAASCWSRTTAFSSVPPAPGARITVTMRFSVSVNDGMSRRTSLRSPAVVTQRW